MSAGHKNFPKPIQRQALARQWYQCASCGERITHIGEAGQAEHKFGERAEAHHVIPHKMDGDISIDNCVVLCHACHISAHQGGIWSDITIYEDIDPLPMPERIAKIVQLYPFYDGARAKRRAAAAGVLPCEDVRVAYLRSVRRGGQGDRVS